MVLSINSAGLIMQYRLFSIYGDVSDVIAVALLLKWINFNPSMDKQ